MQLPKRKAPHYASQAQDPFMSKEKFQELENDLARLYKKRPKAAAEVSRLAEMGDFSENVEYQLAKGRLRGINNAITKIELQLQRAKIIEPSSNKRVEIGHRVTVSVNEKEEKIYTILGSSETNPSAGVISHTSPLGAALLGKQVGELVELNTAHKKNTYTILDIS